MEQKLDLNLLAQGILSAAQWTDLYPFPRRLGTVYMLLRKKKKKEPSEKKNLPVTEAMVSQYGSG